MAKLTNISGTPRAIPLKGGDYVEFARGETKDIPDADCAALAGRDDIKACFEVSDFAEPAEKPKGKAAKKDAE